MHPSKFTPVAEHWHERQVLRRAHTLSRTECDADAVRVGSVEHGPIGRRVEDERTAGGGRRAGFVQAGRVAQEVAVGAERVPVDLAGVEVDQPVRVGVLELQNGFLDFSGRSADLDGDSVVGSRGVGLAIFLSGGKGDYGAA